MTAKILKFPDQSVESVLTDAISKKLKNVFVCGWDEDGTLYLDTSEQNAPELLWMLEMAKGTLIEAGSGK